MTVAGVLHDLPKPPCAATQNPSSRKILRLPEAQLDRFMFQIDVPYPSLEAERRMLLPTTGEDDEIAQRFSRQRS